MKCKCATRMVRVVLYFVLFFLCPFLRGSAAGCSLFQRTNVALSQLDVSIWPALGMGQTISQQTRVADSI